MKSVKVNVYYNSLLSVSQILYPLITFPYASRILGPEGIGLFNFVDSITQYFILIAAFGVPIYGIREIARNNCDLKNRSKVYSELLLIHLIFTIFLVGVYICLFLSIPMMSTNSNMFWIGTGILFFNVFPTEWFFQGMQNFVFVARRTILIRICSIFALFIFVNEKNDVVLYYLINLVAFVLNSIVNLWYSKKFVRFSLKEVNVMRHIRPLSYIFLVNIAVSVYLLMDSIFLGFMINNESVGYYHTSAKITKVFVLLVTAFSMVMIPKLSTLFKEVNYIEAVRLLKVSFEYIFFLTVPICIGIFVVAEDFVRLYAGLAFLPAVITVKIMSPLVFLIGLSNLFGMQILTAKGKEKKLFLAVVSGMTLSICLNLILIPLFEENGAAVSNVCTELLVTLVTGCYALKEVAIKIPWSKFFQALITSLIFIPLYHLIIQFEINYVIRLLVIIIACSIVYVGIQHFLWKNYILKEVFISIQRKAVPAE